MSDNLIFNSMDNPVPPVRKDIQLIPLQYNGDRVLYVHDIMEYIPSDFALNPHVESFLTLFNGRFSIQRILAMVEGQIDGQDLLQFVQLLDKNCLLESPNYRETARQKEEAFELSPARGAALAGNSYPEDPDELEKYLSDLFSPFACSESVQFPEKALYAPHIDPKAGGDVYAKAFSVLRTLTPERVVILGTSHYAGCYPELYANTPFIGSRKIFELPNGRIPTDSGYL
ncbi:MAG: AmmeMemoRadiSam system protein B, partial [Balneolaceae bacterium]